MIRSTLANNGLNKKLYMHVTKIRNLRKKTDITQSQNNASNVSLLLSYFYSVPSDGTPYRINNRVSLTMLKHTKEL